MAEVRPTGTRATVANVALYTTVGVAAILFLVPFYLVLRNGLSSDLDISSPDWKLFPTSLQWSNFADVFDKALRASRDMTPPTA